jgi:hypothetical protein
MREDRRAEFGQGLVFAHQVKIVIGRDLEQAEYLVQHLAVLCGDADRRFDLLRAGQGAHDRRHLDRLRARAEDR